MNNFSLDHDDYFPVSEIIRASLERYINQGIMPGGFLTAVLQNNLSESFGRADMENSANMKNIVGYIYNNIPSDAWGSPKKVTRWLERLTEETAA